MLYASFTVALNSGVATSLSENAAICLASGNLLVLKVVYIYARYVECFYYSYGMLLQVTAILLVSPTFRAGTRKPVESAQTYFSARGFPAHLSYAHACTQEKYGWPARLTLVLSSEVVLFSEVV